MSLTAEKLSNYRPELTKICLLGEECFIRTLSFDEQAEIMRVVSDGDMSDSEATKYLLFLCLSDENGDRLLKDWETASTTLGRINVRELMAAVKSAELQNSMSEDSIEAEVKNS